MVNQDPLIFKAKTIHDFSMNVNKKVVIRRKRGGLYHHFSFYFI